MTTQIYALQGEATVATAKLRLHMAAIQFCKLVSYVGLIW